MKYFPPFRFDERDVTLWMGRARVRLTHKATALLHCLLDHAGHRVSKEAILGRVWPDTHVQPDNIKVLVCELRQALGDDARDPCYIRSEPGRGYAFVAKVTEAAVEDRPDESVAPSVFLNRLPELVAMTDAFEAAVAGQPRVLIVAGERGAGKSALCRMFVRTTAASVPIRHALAQCVEQRLACEPFAPFLDALAQLARAHEAEVRELMAQHAPDWEALFPEWTGRAATWPSQRDGSSMMRQLASFLSALSADEPVVLILEDLQWADRSTWQALSVLQSCPRPARFIVVGTGTGLDQSAPAGSRGIRTLSVPPFSEEQVSRYLSARFGPGILAEAAPTLHELTGGNAFLIVTCLDQLIVQGLLCQVDRRWRLLGSPQRLVAALRDAAIGALDRRLDGIDEGDRTLLEHAALLDEELTEALVAAATGGDQRLVGGGLRRLADAGYLVPQRTRGTWGAGTARYRFRFPIQADALRQRASTLRQLRVTSRLAPAAASAHRQLA